MPKRYRSTIILIIIIVVILLYLSISYINSNDNNKSSDTILFLGNENLAQYMKKTELLKGCSGFSKSY